MSNYECIILARQDLATAQVEDLQKEINEMLKTQSATVVKEEYWGVRSLAYRIKKNRKAHYAYLEFTAETKELEEIQRKLRFQEDILRFLIVKVEDFQEGPTAPMNSRLKDEAREAESGGSSHGSRDEGYRPAKRA